jgi:hypothetical protein
VLGPSARSTCLSPQVTSLPGNLLLFDNGNLSRAMPAVASVTAVAGTLMVYGHAGLDQAGIRSLQGFSNMRVGSGKESGRPKVARRTID